ncbi:MAG: TonB family protein [Holophagales bacterium]|jgi:protein TonB|nr:TonB family protein [Holophagales bacterium]
MGNLPQASKAFGVAGTAILHLWIILICVFAVPRSITKPLPPEEPLRIRLAEASVAYLQSPIVPEMPDIKPSVQEITMPDAVTLDQKTPVLAEESNASNPKEEQLKPARVVEALTERASSFPVAVQHNEQEMEVRAKKLEEAKQAVISVLVASLEREKRYPAAAHRLGIEGQVMALVRVDSQGRIVSTSAKGNEPEPMLERATLEALQRVQKKWTPMPLPEPMTLNIPIRYNLENR